MTDARIPERYLMDRRIMRLTHAQRSSYFMSTLWAVSNRTDGHIEREDLPLIPTFDPSAVDVLVERGLWAVTKTGWVDVDFDTVQTSRDDLIVLENARKADREKKRRHTAHRKDDHSHCSSDNCDQVERVSSGRPTFTAVPSEAPGEVSRGGHRIGEERRGKDKDEVLSEEQEENFAPCCGEVHGPLDPCPREQVRDEPKTLVPPDPGYCGECGMTKTNGVCLRCLKKERAA